MTLHRLILGNSDQDIANKVQAYVAGLAAPRKVYAVDMDFTMNLTWDGASSYLTAAFNKAGNCAVVIRDFDRALDDYAKIRIKKKQMHPSDPLLHSIEDLIRHSKDAVVILTARTESYEKLFSLEKPDVWQRLKQQIIIEGAPAEKPPSMWRQIKRGLGI